MPASRPELSHRGRRPWLWVVVLLLLAAGGYWYWQKNAAAPGPAGRNGAAGRGMPGMAVPVKIATVESGPITHTLKAIGTVTAYKTVTVRSRVDGELQKIAFQNGQKVQEGDLLAEIDPRPYQVQLDQALGQQKQNQAQLQNAQRDLQRYQLLYKQNSIARQQVDAQAALVQQLQGSIKSDQAAVDSAKLQLSFTRITAPITGRLGLRKVDEGNIINASNTDGIVVITQTQPISVLFTLPQAQLPDVLAQLRAGSKLAVELYGRDDLHKLAVGELASVDNQIDVATGTVKLRADFPTQAVQQGSIGAFVYQVGEGDKVHVQPITTGLIDGRIVAVQSGLEPGQRVVTEGVDRLREGAQVEVVAGNPATAAPQPPLTTSGAAGAHGAR